MQMAWNKRLGKLNENGSNMDRRRDLVGFMEKERELVRICDLKEKEVINICDCQRLGCVSDVVIECETGCVSALIVPGPGRFCFFLGRDTEYVIPWCCVEQIGCDIILVKVDVEKVLVKCEW